MPTVNSDSLYPSHNSSLTTDLLKQIERLADKDGYVRIAAAEALGKLRDTRAVEPLCAALKDENPSVRYAVTEALGRLRDPRSVEALCTAFQETDWDVRASAAKALWHLRDPRAVETFADALTDENPYWSRCAAETLGHIGDARAVEPLCYALKDADWDVRIAASGALGRIGDTAGLPLQILSSTALTPAQKISTLQTLKGAYPRIAGKVVRYSVGNVQTFCEKICRQESIEESVRCGAEAVLSEIQNRADARVLLRASAREEARDSQELLRCVSGGPGTAPPDELLRPAETSSPQATRESSGIRSLLFKRN